MTLPFQHIQLCCNKYLAAPSHTWLWRTADQVWVKRDCCIERSREAAVKTQYSTGRKQGTSSISVTANAISNTIFSCRSCRNIYVVLSSEKRSCPGVSKYVEFCWNIFCSVCHGARWHSGEENSAVKKKKKVNNYMHKHSIALTEHRF